MRKTTKRMIAGVMSAVLSLGLVNYSAISKGFASVPNGYSIDVEYAEDHSSATLVGNTSAVKEHIQLEKLVDANGQEMDPATFSQTVNENGTYSFTLYYQETVASEKTTGEDAAGETTGDATGDATGETAEDANGETTGETVVSKTEELKVVVDGIVKAEANDQDAAEATDATDNDVVDQGTEAQPETQQPATVPENTVITAAETVPLEVLQRSLAENRATNTYPVDIYATEADVKLSAVNFSGGALVKGAEGLPVVEYRTLESAVYIGQGGTSEFKITGLYYYNSKWYYTVGDSTASTTDAGDISVGFVLPSNASVRLYYGVTDTTKRNLTIDGKGSLADYKLTINGDPCSTGTTLQYPARSKVVLEFVLPTKFKDSSTVNVTTPSINSTFSNAKGVGTTLVDNQLTKISEFKYTLMFTMPEQATTVTFTGVPWPDNTVYYFGLGTTAGAPQSGEQPNDSHFRSTGGTISKAEVTHTTDRFFENGQVQYFNPLDFYIGPTQKKTFSEGSYEAGTTLTFDLRMNRYYEEFAGNPYFTWKPTVLVLQVYVDQTYAGPEYHRYLIPLAYTSSATNNENMTVTPLDCGATVTTVCTEFTDNAYQYTITIEGMVHNFALYDKPTSTIQQNYLVTGLDGIKLNNGTQGATSASYVSYRPGGQGANNQNKALQLYDLFLASETNTNSTMDMIEFYIEPLEGYTKPIGKLENQQANCFLSSNPVWLGGKMYQYLVPDIKNQGGVGDGTKAPARLSFTSQPLTFDVKYYNNNNSYYNTGVKMSISQNSYYAIEYKVPEGVSNIKGYRLKLYDSGGNLITDITNSANSNGLWYPNQDVISFTDIYNKLKTDGKVPTDANCVLRVVPEVGAAGEGITTSNYAIKMQNKYAALDNNGGGHLSDENSSTVNGSISAYVGSTVNLFGYEQQFVSGEKKYKLNTKVSNPSGTVTADGTPFATLEYVLATAVTVDKTSLGDIDEADIETNTNAIAAIESKWYTSVNNFDHTISLATLKSGTRENQVFNGWAIKGKNGTSVSLGTNATSVNLYSLFGPNKNTELWSEIFNNGTCTLEATWRSAVSKVTTAGGTSITNADNSDVVILEGKMPSFNVTADFRYGDGNTSYTDVDKLLKNGTLKIALLKKDAGTNKQWQVLYGGSTTGLTPSIGQGTKAGDFKVTFTINADVTSADNNGANFRIYAWTSVNEGGTAVAAQDICNALNGASTQDKYTGQIPSVNTYTEVRYQVKSAGGTAIGDEGVYTTTSPKMILEGGDGTLTITGEFRYGDGTISASDVEKLWTDGTLKIALLKKDAERGTEGVDYTAGWTVRYSKEVTVNLDAPTITDAVDTDGNKTGDFEVKFTIKSGAFAAYNNGANFRIYAWTDANEGATTAQDICDSLNGITQKNYTGKIPSVNTYTQVLYKVKLVGGTISDTNAEDSPKEFKDGQTENLEITAKFQYGDGTVSLEEIKKLIKPDTGTGAMKIALLVKDPQTDKNPKYWDVQYDKDTNASKFGDPAITSVQGGAANTFQVTFTITASQLKGKWSDGANLRIFAWTSANASGSTVTADNICTALNGADTQGQYAGQIPSVNTQITKLYKVTNDTKTSSDVSVNATDKNIALTGTFKYNYDGTRYTGGDYAFTADMLTKLIEAEKFSAKIVATKNAVTLNTITLNAAETSEILTAGEDGIINFAYNFEDSISTDLSAYDGATFEITLSTATNGTDETAYPAYTITVTYISDPGVYVDIPKYVILEDGKANVAGQEDSYAGKKVTVGYKKDTPSKPEISIGVQDGVKLRKGSITGPEQENMAIGIYDTSGAKITPDTDGYSSIGTLTETSNAPDNPGTLSFWMNTPRGTVKNEQYYATVMFKFALAETGTQLV